MLIYTRGDRVFHMNIYIPNNLPLREVTQENTKWILAFYFSSWIFVARSQWFFIVINLCASSSRPLMTWFMCWMILDVSSSLSSKWMSPSHLCVVTSPCDVDIFVSACSHFSGSWSSASELWKHRWSPFNDHDSLIKISKCEYGVMDQHLFSNLLQPSEIPASKQLATNHPVLTGLELDIINSDAWELHQALPLKGSREAYNPHQAVYLIVVV